ncbi:peptidase M3 [Sphingopyxis sp. H071]|nr:peptidase M3 [Sphingopyxis sp. H057]KTE50275.1 peptidase M3 [Sphingopyxis sp. H073]KTE50662.1 peptidase M3 [Sphingopyxis sp. H071]KTE59947.1 peptidase M3 [Sphingopyxis sp. H107]KTE63729.1 peptidase M3 [Sphingopyxis sp. H100]KTE71816.1 peptidase M3 [Sphingopyxis sp. H081]KTE83097.1 peptidase M3 [Sphingopyxis sp. H067]
MMPRRVQPFVRLSLLASTVLLMGYSPMTIAAETATKPAAAEAGANPMLQPWTGPYEGVPPWDKLDPELFPDAFAKGMAEVKAEVQAVIDNPAEPTFENTHVPMQLAGESMERVFALWGVQTSNKSNDRVEDIDAEWSPKLTKFYTELFLDPKLFARYKAVYDKRLTSGLNAQQIRIVERSYDEMVRDGANLSAADKAKLVDLNAKLEGLFSAFSSKLLGDEKLYTFVTDKAELAGLAPGFVASLADAAEAQGKPGQWAIKNTRSSAQPVLQNAASRGLREKVWRAFVGRGDNGDANDTNATIAEILKLRQQRAELLGFATHANYRMADTMAKTPENAMALMMKVWPAAVARVHEEVADMQAIADAEAKAGKGPKLTIEPWDYRYYAEKVRKAKYDLDESEVKPYLQLDKLRDAMFWSAGQLYDLGFREITGTIPVFDPKVKTFEVYNLKTNENVGVLYLDNFARDGKRSGAWMTTYRSQQGLGGERNVLASNNNNFTEGAKGEPTLVSLDDAQTLFHEFGHGIHYLLQHVYYPALAGVPRDFVEYPSQVNENWLMTPEVLSKFATHYKTGEPMPQALVDKILASNKFNQGFETVEYLSSAIVDMKLHDRKVPVTDVDKFERETLKEMGMPKEIVMRHRLPQFGHLFSSDAYSAGYYSYLWSETMDADTWAAFNEAGGPWDRTVADKFRTILLMTGNETDRAEAYRAFRGRDPDVKALLRKRGFPTE